MYECIHVCIHIYVCVYLCIHKRVYIYVCMYIYTYMYVCMCVYMSVYVNVYTYMYVYIRIRIRILRVVLAGVIYREVNSCPLFTRPLAANSTHTPASEAAYRRYYQSSGDLSKVIKPSRILAFIFSSSQLKHSSECSHQIWNSALFFF